jgi:nitrite reductase/ring-hydroxylating ferredoxin subunit
MQTNTQTHGENTSNRSESPKGDGFPTDVVRPSTGLLIGDTVVFNTAGRLCAADAKCPRLGCPLNEGILEGSTATRPWHGSKFNVCAGAVVPGPAKDLVKTYTMIVGDESRHVETGK